MKEITVSRIRQFNRFYLPLFDLLGNSYLGSEYSAAEARVLYEIYSGEEVTAASISRAMNLDKSYLSRVIREHERKGYLLRIPSPTDSRAYILRLTDKGIARTEDFIEKSNRQIGKKIDSLSDRDCARLTEALDTITEILRGNEK